MILSDVDIRKHIDAGIIKIDPTPNFEEQLGPCSLDLHLGNSFKIFRVSRYPFIDLKSGVNVDELMEEVIIADGGSFIIQPHDFVIAVTKEEITLPATMMGRLDGRSSLARLGLVIHVTAARRRVPLRMRLHEVAHTVVPDIRAVNPLHLPFVEQQPVDVEEGWADVELIVVRPCRGQEVA